MNSFRRRGRQFYSPVGGAVGRLARMRYGRFNIIAGVVLLLTAPSLAWNTAGKTPLPRPICRYPRAVVCVSVNARIMAHAVLCKVMSEATRILDAMSNGDAHASAKLLPLVYEELQRIARAQMAQERAGHTLQATALVHDAYLRLLEGAPDRWETRRHFIAAAAEAMRRILVEHARRKHSLKRGGGHERVDLDDEHLPAMCSPCDDVEDLLSLNEALERLSKEDPAKAELVKLLYFAGLNLEEAAAVMEISRTSAYRQWIFTRAWLCNAMTPPQS
jgi:RNA polymerase sigma factor (TIGR02999 family)